MSRFYPDSPRASAMLCPSLAREGRNVRFADVGVSTLKNTTINSSYDLDPIEAFTFSAEKTLSLVASIRFPECQK
jgi:hypothetical protein